MKVSHSAVKMYTECGRKYRYHYLEKLRSKVTSGALIMGNALDKGLNVLLTERNLDKAKEEFSKTLLHSEINKKVVYVPTSHLVVYSKRDFDEKLLLPEDEERFKMIQVEYQYEDSRDVGTIIKELQKKKSMFGLTDVEKSLLSLGNYLSLNRKGLVMLTDYEREILPRIKEVIAVQEKITLTNADGDTIEGFIDLVAKLDDGKIYILDNKTTSSFEYYPDNSAMKSQQLIIYKHAMEEKYGVDAVGFIVLLKNIDSQSSKSCGSCKVDGTGSRARTCAEEYNGKRCGGEWVVKNNPKMLHKWVLNEVPQAAEDLVIDVFDIATEGIKMGNFPPNLDACYKNENFKCPYLKKCWEGKNDELESVD